MPTDHNNAAFEPEEDSQTKEDPSSSSSSGVSSSEDLDENKESIAVLGSGDFGRALAGRIAQAGFAVKIGSRDPERNR